VYQGPKVKQKGIDSLLIAINNEVSTYIPSSVISRYNNNSGVFMLNSGANHFNKNWAVSQKVYKNTDGYFDPTVMPLINFWGFGYTEKKAQEAVDSSIVTEMMTYVGLDKVQLKNFNLNKPHPNAQLDFSAIAKGYAVDEIGKYLDAKGLENYLVEVGGETLAQGLNAKGQKWNIGINTPKADADIRDFELVVGITNKALASSGNYRNFHIVGDKMYGHTINPMTGYPSLNDLLGVSVIADECMIADAYATSFMSMGLEKAKNLVENLENIEACFLTGEADGRINKTYSNGFIQFVRGSGE